MNSIKIISLFILVFHFCCALAQTPPERKNFSETEINDFKRRNDEAYKALIEGKTQEAITLSDQILRENPYDGNATYTFALANFNAKNFIVAERYLSAIEEVHKTEKAVYSHLGVAYYFNRRDKHKEQDFTKSIDFIGKAIKLDPNYLFAYSYRSKLYLDYYNIYGLRDNSSAKNSYYADLRNMIRLDPNNILTKYEYAKNSSELGDFAQAIPIYSKILESPMLNIEIVNEIGSIAGYTINKAEEKNYYNNIWIDGISLMKGLKKGYEKLETDGDSKSKKINEIITKIIEYRKRKANGNTAEYLNSAEYLAEVTEAINAGYVDFYKNRIEIYTFKKQFALANADRQMKLIADEKDLLGKLIADEKQMRYNEENFKKGQALNSEDFKTVLGMKKSRLKLLDRIIALNIPQADKDAFSKRRKELADIIDKSNGMLANYNSEAEANQQQQNRDAGSINRYNEAAKESVRLYKIVAARTSAVEDCRMLVDNYIKKCMKEKLEFNVRDLKNSLYYAKEARKHAESITNYESKRNFLNQAEKIISTIEDGLRINEKELVRWGG